MNIEQDLLQQNKALTAELANARIETAHHSRCTAGQQLRAEMAEARIRELEAELAADNELFQQRWREWQAERDRLDRSMRESWASEKRLAARIRELEAALREIAVGLLPEDRAAGDGKMYMLCASRLCGIARDALRLPVETEGAK